LHQNLPFLERSTNSGKYRLYSNFCSKYHEDRQDWQARLALIGFGESFFRNHVLSSKSGAIVNRIVFLIFLTAIVLAPSAAAPNPAGDWIGEMNSGFKVRIHIEKSGAGFTGKLINPSGNETVLDQVTSDGTRLRFMVAKLSLTYDGVWNEQENLWKGNLTFQQVYALTLRRASAAELAPAVHKRPQEAAIRSSPAPYANTDVEFQNAAAHNRLAGTLSVPKGTGPFPAVVLISGTGHNTRDEDVWGHKVFLVLADALARKGVAALRYDKRGVGGSSGDFDSATTADFTSDAEAAAAWLRKQPEIDPRRIGLLGHSEGGIIAPAIAAGDKDIAFVVMIAGPCIRGDKLFELQSALTAKVYGAPDDYIAKRKAFDKRLYAAVVSAPSELVARDRAKALVAQGLADKIVDANEAENLAHDVTTPWERYFLAYDPAPTLARVNVPVLVLNGSLDVQVPAKEDLAPAREALKNNPCAVVMELRGMNHLLQDAKTGAPNEYNEIEMTISPEALEIITGWVNKVTSSFGTPVGPAR
jgi:pimeloyl-ACP methyl ester carboxylesterase